MSRVVDRGPRLAGVVFAVALGSSAAFARGQDRQWRSVPVAGGVDALSAAAGLAPGLPAWRVLFEACRRKHGLWGEDMEPALASAGVAPAPRAGRVVALPLSPETWRTLLSHDEPGEEWIAPAILADRRSALVYRGLAGLDETTLAALAGDPALAAIRQDGAEAFAAFGGRFRVRGGAVVLPGGPGAAAAWERLVGASPGSPGSFLLALLRDHGGRRAFLFDSLMRLDDARQRFAVGLELPADTRRVPLLALAAVFDGEEAWWRHEGRAFARSDGDTARLLREVALTPAGALAPPASQAFWEAVFDHGGKLETAPSRAGAAPAASAAWLAERIGRGAPATRCVRLEQLLFAQRVFAQAPPASLGDTALAVAGVRDARGLVLALEQMGSRDPGLFAAGVRAARPNGRTLGFQGALAIVQRARVAGTLDLATAERLARGLFELPPGSAALRGRALAGWLESQLLPAFTGAAADAVADASAATSSDASAPDAGQVVLRALTGDLARSAPPAVEWEGLWYRVDPARGERQRAQAVRERQGGPGLSAALAACRAAASRRDGCAEGLGRALAALLYAVALGDADGPALAGGDPSLHHELGPYPWALPEEVFASGAAWHIGGSLVGLERALAAVALRSQAQDVLPEQPPVLSPAHARSLAAAAASASPHGLTDRGRDELAGRIDAGRRLVAALEADTPEVEAACRDAALEPWRARAFEWLLHNEPQARDSFFSLGELLLLGEAAGSPACDECDGWGVADTLAAGLRPRLPGPWPLDDTSGRQPEPAVAERFVDLPLRVALHLRDRRLPAILAPAVTATLLTELLAEARPLAPDDRLGLDAWVRELSRERLDDAVASLAGRGPLQPAAAPREAR